MPASPAPSSFGFTAASLRPELVGIMAEKFAESGSWEDTRAAILATNALQFRSLTSSICFDPSSNVTFGAQPAFSDPPPLRD